MSLVRGATLVAFVMLVAACGYPDPTPPQGQAAGVTAPTPTPSAGGDIFSTGADKTPIKYPDGLQYVDIKTGTGAMVQKNDQVSVHYTGWLADGSKFDSSRDRGQPFDLTIGQGQVIAGWDEGIPGMKVGGIRRLVIPSSLAYGSTGSSPVIPANATLVFIVEVLNDTGQAPPSPSASPS
jgi:peptidylprolyl isomerase